MGKQFVVAHVTKYKGSDFSSGALGRHIDREHVPDNARAEDQALNFEAVDRPNMKMSAAIDKRISEGYKGSTAIRKDAVTSCGVIFSGSTEQMKKIERAGLMTDWARDTVKFASERWGAENIVRATVHLDEEAPHMHLHFVPLTKDGRLSAKDIITQKSLKELQTDYARHMSEYGLERGLSGSKAKHRTTKQYYAQQNEITAEVQSIMENPDQAKEIVRQLLIENKALKAEKTPIIKRNPDKQNIHENPSRERSGGENKQGRDSNEIKRPNRGFSF